MKQIMNGGIWAGIARIVKEEGGVLSEGDEARLKMLDALPKGEWIDLDDDGNPISREESEQKEKGHMSRFTVIDKNK